MRQSLVVAGQPMDAVLRFAGTSPSDGGKTPGMTTNGHSIENMGFSGSGLANYSVAGQGSKYLPTPRSPPPQHPYSWRVILRSAKTALMTCFLECFELF